MDVGTAAPGARLRLGMLRETYELALEVAGDVWPTPAMALGALFERGVAFLEGGGELVPIRGGAPADLLDALNRAREELLAAEAQYAFTRYLVLTLTRESEALEATWLGLADEHLRIKAEIVAGRRREEQLKRELAALGAATVPLPEHDEPAEIPPDRPRKSRGMYARLLEGAEAFVAELDVAADRPARADRLSHDRGWATEWGEQARLLVFAHGLALALREREADAVDPDDAASVRSAWEEARGRLMGLDGRSATLRFRLFELRRDVRILGWRITALRVEARGMRGRLELFEQDRGRLEAELTARRAATPPSAESVPPRGWRARLARLFSAGGRDA